MRAYEFITEADRIGTALYKNQIPPQYKKYPVIGQGATSVVLEKDSETVYVLTRDAHKRDWLVNGIEIAEWIDSFDAYHPNPKIRNLPVYVMVCPKLLPLSNENKRIIRKEIKTWGDFLMKRISTMRWAAGKNHAQQMALKTQDAMQDYMGQFPNGLFVQLFDHLSNYDLMNVSPDLLMRNFMQDVDGNIVLIDPVVDKEIVAAFNKPMYEGKILSESITDIRQDARRMDVMSFLNKYVAEMLPQHKSHPKAQIHDYIYTGNLDPSEWDSWQDWNIPHKVAGGPDSKEKVEKFTNDILRYQKLPPVLVNGTDDDFGLRPQVIDGHHRTAAYMNAGKDEVPVVYDIWTLIDVWGKENNQQLKNSDKNEIYKNFRTNLKTSSLTETKTLSIKFPYISFEKLYHIGTFQPEHKKNNSLEGSGLSVTTEPTAWRKISPFINGELWELTKQSNKFLDVHKLNKICKQKIIDWGVENKYIELSLTYRVSYYDDELESEVYSDYTTKEEAFASADDPNDIEIIKNGIVATKKLKSRTLNACEPTIVLDCLIPVFVEDCLKIDGVWWNDALDVGVYSAPRGVITLTQLPTWKKSKIN